MAPSAVWMYKIPREQREAMGIRLLNPWELSHDDAVKLWTLWHDTSAQIIEAAWGNNVKLGTNLLAVEIWSTMCRQIELAKAEGLLDVLEGKLESLLLSLYEVYDTDVNANPPPNELFAFIDLPDGCLLSLNANPPSSTPPVQHPQTPSLAPGMITHLTEHRDLVTEAINTLDFPFLIATTSTTDSNNPSQKPEAKVSASDQVTMPAQHQDSSVSASVARDTQEVDTTTTSTTSEPAPAMSGSDPSDPTAATPSSTTTPAPESKKNKKNRLKKLRRKDKNRAEKLRAMEEPPVTDSHEAIDQASLPVTDSHETIDQAETTGQASPQVTASHEIIDQASTPVAASHETLDQASLLATASHETVDQALLPVTAPHETLGQASPPVTDPLEIVDQASPPITASPDTRGQASPPVTDSHEVVDQASPPGTVPPSRESSQGIRASLETSLLVSAAEVRPEGDDLEDVVAKCSTPPPTSPTPDEADPPSSLTMAAETTMAAGTPSPSSSDATENRELWKPWWNFHYHGKTILSWQHWDGRQEPIPLSALVRDYRTDPLCYFHPYCKQHTPKTLCWCPECRSVPRWCCCAHYTRYCIMGPRLPGGLIMASWPKQSASRAAPEGAEVCTSAAPAETTAMTVPGQHGLAAEETQFKGQKLSVQKAASECDPSADVSTPLFLSTRRPRTVVRRLSWPMTFCSGEERYPM